MKKFTIGVLAAILLLAGATLLLTNVSAEEATGELALGRYEYDCIIKDSYATIDVKLTYSNTANVSLEESVEFDVPDGFFITNFSYAVGGKTFYGWVEEKAQAQQTYDDAVSNGTGAALLEKTYRGYKININVEPDEHVTLGMRYESFLARQLGGYEMDLGIFDPTGGEVVDEVDIFIRIDYHAVISGAKADGLSGNTNYLLANTRCEIEQTNTESTIPDAGTLTFDTEKLADAEGIVASYKDGDDGYFMHVFCPEMEGIGYDDEDYLPKDIVFVLDESGSMSGDKISQMKDAFATIVEDLYSDDTFNVVRFSTDVTTWKTEPVKASESNIDDAKTYINNIEAGGSTNIDGALKGALADLKDSETRIPVVVFLTDGLPSEGETITKNIRANVKDANTANAAIFSIAFGNDADLEFLQAMSLENNGKGIQIDAGSDASTQLVGFYDTISTPLLKSIKFSYAEEGTNLFQIYPDEVDNFFDGQEVIVVGRYSGISSLTFEGTAEGADGSIDLTKVFALDGDADNDYIARLWAFNHIDSLRDQMLVADDDQPLIDEIVNLSIQYNFVNEYTSLVVVIDDEEPTDRPTDEHMNIGMDNDGIGDSGYDPYAYGAPGGGGGGGGAAGGAPTDSGSYDKDDASGEGPLTSYYPLVPGGDGGENDGMNLIIIAPIVLIGVVLFVIIGIVVVMIMVKNRTNTEDNEDPIESKDSSGLSDSDPRDEKKEEEKEDDQDPVKDE